MSKQQPNPSAQADNYASNYTEATLTAVASYGAEQVKTAAGDKLAEWFD